MAQKQGNSSTGGGRIDGSVGTASVAGDFVLGAGWGTTPVVALLAGSTDQRGQLTITCDATAAQATATVVHTYSDGAYATQAPVTTVQVQSDSAITDSNHCRSTSTTTACTWTLDVLPVDTKIYVWKYVYVA